MARDRAVPDPSTLAPVIAPSVMSTSRRAGIELVEAPARLAHHVSHDTRFRLAAGAAMPPN